MKTGLLILLAGSVAGWATDAKAGSSDALSDVLKAEVSQSVDRAARLADQRGLRRADPQAMWQSGWLRDGRTWRPATVAVAAPDERKLLREYASLRKRTEQSPEAQMKLAGWCRARGLVEQQRTHLHAAVAQRPDLATAAVLARMGYRKYRGRWLSPEELRDAQSQHEILARSKARWARRLAPLIRRFDGGQITLEETLESLKDASTPDVVPAVEAACPVEDRERSVLAVELLKRIDGYQASLALTRLAVGCPWKSVRGKAITELRERRFEDFVPGLMSLLEPEIQLEIKSDPWTLTRSTMHWFVMRRETENEIQVAATGLRINPITTRRIVRGFTGRTRAAAIDSNATRDAARRIQGQSFLTEREVEIANARADAGNERIMAVLNGISDGTGSRRTVSDWWQWWDRYADIERPQEKRLVKVAETRVNEVDIPVVTVQERGECFAPETPVMTRQGLRPIRSIQPGDLVLSKDVSTGELAYKPVLHKSVGRPRALLRLTIGSEEFITTAGHQFWQSGDGWKQARQLSVDGRIHSLQRSEAVQNLTGGPVVAPHNLVVADTHTFFVGESLLLVHDLMLPRPTNCVVPGLAKHELNDVDR